MPGKFYLGTWSEGYEAGLNVVSVSADLHTNDDMAAHFVRTYFRSACSEIAWTNDYLGGLARGIKEAMTS